MKRTVCLLLAAVMLFGTILTSCNTLPEIPKDEVLFENDEYILERKDGVGRLNFKNGNQKDEISEGGCVVYSSVIGFIGMDQLMAAYRNGFSEWGFSPFMNSEFYDQEVYGRTIDSMMIEWDAHNALYMVNKHVRLQHVDFDYRSEGMTGYDYLVLAIYEWIEEN